MYIDSHIHLDGEEFTEDLDQVVARAKSAGAEKLFVPGINPASIQTVQDLCRRYPDYCYGMIGLHPEDVTDNWEQDLQEMEKHLDNFPWIAIGEIGLDYYFSREKEEEQKEAFRRQLKWAEERNLPLMLHCRSAQNEMLKIFEEEYPASKKHDGSLRGVFHCFTGNEQEARRYLEYEHFCLGIGGVVTFKNAKLGDTLKAAVPLERIVLETDAPYMAPAPNRGKRNESSFIPYIIDKLADVYSTTREEVARITSENVKRLFPMAYSVFLLCLMTLCTLTSCDPSSIVKKGDKALAIGEYFVAANYYRQAYSKTPSKEKTLRGERALKMAQCYDKINNTQKAIGGYRNAIRYNTIDMESRLAFARALLKNGDYKGALAEFRLLQDSLPDNVLVQNGLLSAQKAPEWKAEGSSYTVKRVDFFNSRRGEYSPCLAGDDYDRLYFASTRNDSQGEDLNGVTGMKSADIFFSEKDDKGKWSKPKAIASGLNTEYDEGSPYVSPDGTEMYITQCTYDASYPRYARVMISKRSDASWGASKEVLISKDTLSAFAHPAITPDGQWLYFVSDMPGGKGGLDIWRTRLVGGEPAGIENLGEPINTPGNEMFPTFRPNGDFYFSSDGHPGMGGLDIFIAKVGKDNRYHIEHPGYPLNSQADDFGMTFEGFHNRGFFSSSRGDGRGNDHIFSFEKPEIVQLIKGWIYEIDGYELQAGEAYIVGSDGTNQRMGVKSDGSFEYVAEPGVDYILLATCNGFLNHKEEVSVPANVKTSETYTLQFPLANISQPVLIDNIFFEFDKARLLPTSTKALDSLVIMLNDNPNVTIELAAHTDYKGSAEYNQKLSQKRAEAVVAYLIHKGIAADRLTPRGYGEDAPKRIRKKVAEHYPWLNEGDVLTEAFINKLKPAEQVTANAMNRRTEFKVLRTTYNMFDKDGNLKNPPKPRKQPVNENAEEDGFFFDMVE